MFYYSRDRGGEHVEAHLARWSGLLQADAYAGYKQLYVADRAPGPILEAACWAHARRPSRSPISRPVPAARPRARCLRRSHHWHWKRSGASIGCSKSSAPSMGRLAKSARLFAKSSDYAA